MYVSSEYNELWISFHRFNSKNDCCVCHCFRRGWAEQSAVLSSWEIVLSASRFCLLLIFHTQTFFIPLVLYTLKRQWATWMYLNYVILTKKIHFLVFIDQKCIYILQNDEQTRKKYRHELKRSTHLRVEFKTQI